MTSRKIVLNVGQCGFDHSAISNILKELGAEAVNINTANDLKSYLKNENPRLILINRILDSDGESGIEILKELKSNPITANIPAMLVSNYASAQAEAVSLGGLQGFGKESLRSKETLKVLESIINS